jgi:hypothetical protein
MSAVYPSTKDLLLRGDIDFLVDTFMLQMVGNYVYDATDTVASDVTAKIDAAVQVSVASVSGGMAIANDVTFSAVSSGLTVTGLVVYRDAVDLTSADLIAYINRRSDSTPVRIPTSGGDITFTFTNYLIKL